MTEANAQTRIIERDIADLKKDVSLLSEGQNKQIARLDRHLEIYAQNGKELASVKTALEGLKTATIQAHDDRVSNHMEIWKQIKTNQDNISNIQVEIGKLGVRTAFYSASASAIASGVILIVIERFLL